MGESHKLTDLGGMKGSVGGMGDRRRRNRQIMGEIHVPEAVGGIAAVASQDGFIVMGDSHGMLGEGGRAVGIAELANGEKRRVEAVKDVGFGCSSREAWDGQVAHGMRQHGGAVGHGDRDGGRVSEHIGKASGGRRKEMAGSAGVSNSRGGRGINWWGRKCFN